MITSKSLVMISTSTVNSKKASKNKGKQIDKDEINLCLNCDRAVCRPNTCKKISEYKRNKVKV